MTSKAAAADRAAKVQPRTVAPTSAWKSVKARSGYKPCHRCAVSRPVADFAVNKAHRDGLCDFDRQCNAEYSAERRAARKAAGTLPAKKAPAAKAPAAKKGRTSTKASKSTGGQPRAPRAPRPARTPIARVSGTTVEAVSA